MPMKRIEERCRSGYRYVQSELSLCAELQLSYQLSRLFKLDAQAEFVFTTDGVYPIPFTPPLQLVLGIDHDLPVYWKKLHFARMRLEMISVAKQDQVARNELVTPAYHVFNFSFSTKVITRLFPAWS